MGMAMGIGQILIIIGLLLSAISAGFLALAELKIKRESKVLVSKKWRPHPELVDLLRERRKYALYAVVLLFTGFVLQLVGTILL